MAGSVNVTEVHDRKAQRDFANVPFIVQGSNPVWVPPLRVQEKDLLDPKKNPFFKHAKMKKFVAYSNGKPVGRIAAIQDDAHNSKHEEKTCKFGFFETIDDSEIATALFKTVSDVAKAWNLDKILGPFNPSINDTVGVLMNAYDRPPVIMMPYNPPYYPKLLEDLGFAKAIDMVCYRLTSENMTDKVRRGAEIIRKRSKLKFRHFEKKHFWRDAMKLWDVYNKAWESNWGAVQMTEEEFHHLAKELKQVVDYDFVNFAEKEDGELVGFSLALPNINEAVIKIRDGRLFPFGLPKLMWHTRKGAIHSVRVVLMGVLDEYRGRGLDTLFHYDNIVTGQSKGIYWGELSWVLETNKMMNRVADMVGAEKYKTYRMYEKALVKKDEKWDTII